MLSRVGWRLSWVFLAMASVLGCNEAVELDPGWSAQSIERGGESSAREDSRRPEDGGGQERKAAERAVEQEGRERPDKEENSCPLAVAGELRLSGPLPPKRSVTFSGALGSKAAGAELSFSGPSGWIFSPATLFADGQGRFLSTIRRDEKGLGPDERIRVRVDGGGCWSIRPEISAKVIGEKSELKVEKESVECHVTEKISLSIHGRGSTSLTGFQVASSAPQIGDVISFSSKKSDDGVELELVLSCKARGRFSILIVHVSFEPHLFWVEVQ